MSSRWVHLSLGGTPARVGQGKGLPCLNHNPSSCLKQIGPNMKTLMPINIYIYIYVRMYAYLCVSLCMCVYVYILAHVYIYNTRVYMSVRQYSWLIPCHGCFKWGGPVAVACFGAAENKGIAVGGFSHNMVTLQSWTEGHRFGGTCCMIPIYLTQFLFFVRATRILTIAHGTCVCV